MQRVYTVFDVLKPVLTMGMLPSIVFQSNGQQDKSAESDYTPVDGSKAYFKVYGEGKPIVLLHGAFITIKGN